MQIYIVAYRKIQTPLPSIPSVSPSFPPSSSSSLSSLPVVLRVLLLWLPLNDGSSPFWKPSCFLFPPPPPPATHVRVHMLSQWSNGGHPSHGWVFIWGARLLLSVPSYNNMTPLSPLTAVKDTFGWKIPPLHTEPGGVVGWGEVPICTHSHMVVLICKESPHRTHYRLINIVPSEALCPRR